MTLADRVQLEKYLRLPQKGSVIAEYVWIDASNGMRSKCKVSHLRMSAQSVGGHKKTHLPTLSRRVAPTAHEPGIVA